MRARLLILALLTVAIRPAAAGPALPATNGPDIPTIPGPLAAVAVFVGERFECTGSPRTKTIDVPVGDWDRIMLEVRITPDGDPWDRLFGVGIGGVEVLRGTTPRAEMTIRKDITRFAALLPPGGEAEVSLLLSTYVGALLGDVTLFFHAEQPAAPLARAPTAVVPIVLWGSLTGNGTAVGDDVVFPDDAPASAELELTITGHGDAESWFLNGWQPRIFRVFVEDVQVAEARSMPYVYALAGFGAGDPYETCAGPRTGATGDTAHPLMWWTGQRVLDAAGVHLGVGEIPPYRATIDAEHLALLRGARTVEVRQVGPSATWVTSLSLALGS